MAEADRIAAALAYQGATAAPPTMAQELAKVPSRLIGALKALGTGSSYGSAEPVNAVNDLARTKFWRGSVFGVPEDVQQRNQARAMEAVSMAAPIVYHGSPHRFAPTAKNPLGEFNPTKIGTGEGAQAYGYGHYLAEKKDIAKSYANDVAGIAGARGSRVKPAPEESIANDVQNFLGEDIGGHAADRAEKIYSRSGKTIYEFEDGSLGLLDSQGNFQAFAKPESSLYKVDLPDEVVPRMLDWDKPLSEQSNIIKNINPKNLGLTYTQLPNGNHAYVNANGEIIGNLQKGGTKEGFANNWIQATLEGTGRTLYNQLGQGMGGSEKTSKALLNAGIPGIKYLDEASRGAGTGTRNFVVFPGNEGLLNILGRE